MKAQKMKRIEKNERTNEKNMCEQRDSGLGSFTHQTRKFSH